MKNTNRKEQNNSQNESNRSELTTLTTLEELGANLPLGKKNKDGKYQRDIVLRRWNYKMNRELSKKKGPHDIMFKYAAIVLATMCKKLGPFDFENTQDDLRTANVYSLFMGDVLYAYCYLRSQAMGNDMNIPIVCPNCSRKFEWELDLRTLPVYVADSEESLCWEKELREPVEMRGKEVKKIGFGPALWSGISSTDPNDESSQETAIITASIRNFDGNPVQAVEKDLDELGKRDIEEILRDIAINSIGPDMSFDVKCPNDSCRLEWRMMINWTYDSFFGVSSL